MASTNTTSQLRCTQQGGPFSIIHIPAPTPASNQVLIRQRVLALNLLDVKQRDSFRHGAFPERVVEPEGFVAKKPKGIGLEQAPSLPSCFITAVCGIIHSLKIPLRFFQGTPTEGHAPPSILVLGCNSCVGAAAIQLLRAAYPSLPIRATSSTRHHHARVKEISATSIIDYKRFAAVANIRVASPKGAGVDTEISGVLDQARSRRYAFVLTGDEIPLPEGVNKIAQVISSLTGLVDEGKYRVPLLARVVGQRPEQLPDMLDEVKTVSGEKVVVTL
ncbi:hypothetical protein BDV29DRAFT_195615 [Aspergillus leporis]|uniref:Alcohol dehydrogenase-like C-terminal domain-containing protein n=1 Tax=Aspergillus leporis TaxID=41062 RepID=A0A5N5WN96_9EURO|nr:hypothetical protein BDV29DRAFT_195615 [Aspergillus leporis]